MSDLITPELIRQAPRLSEALGLEAESFGRFLTARDKVLTDRQHEHEKLMCESTREELAWAE